MSEDQLRQISQAMGDLIKPFPLVPSDPEILANPRARSAKLRVITKLTN